MDELRKRLEALSPEKRALLLERLNKKQPSQQDVSAVSGDTKQLVAYAVPKSGHQPTPDELRDFLQDRLPIYMTPANFILMDNLPRTPNGKVDRRALPEPEPVQIVSTDNPAEPRNNLETLLAGIWADVLGFEEVGIHDNFFEMGGDSIFVIQIVARAHQVGIQLTPQQILEHKTVAEVATVAELDRNEEAEQDLVTGDLPLTPIQHWFFEQEFAEAHHWNQAVMLEMAPDLDVPALEETIRYLLSHHDTLRLGFVQKDNHWQAFHADPNLQIPIARFDLSALSDEDQNAEMESITMDIQRHINLKEGGLICLALFKMDSGQPDRLLIIIHHLVVDNMSWRILLEDLESVYRQLRQGEKVKLPPKTTSYKRWAEALNTYAQSEIARAEAEYWLNMHKTTVAPIPVDHVTDKSPEASSFRLVLVELDRTETQTLVNEVQGIYNLEMNDILLTALVKTMVRWSGRESVALGIERNGRESIIEDLNLSRTSGWFTAYYPAILHLKQTDHGAALKSIKDQFRQISQHGIGYGVLRYLNNDDHLKTQLANLPQPEIQYNYLGQIDTLTSDSDWFKVIRVPTLWFYSPRNRHPNILVINARIVDACLQVEWLYSRHIHHQSTIEKLAEQFKENLRALIAHCQSAESDGYTPSDFPEAGLDQEELDQFLDGIN